MSTSNVQTVYGGGGGGGLTGITSDKSTVAPNDGVHASRITPDVTSASGDLVLYPKGQGAIIAGMPNGLNSGGDKRGFNAVDFQTVRSNNTFVASGYCAVIAGGRNNTAANQYAGILAGYQNYAGGQFSGVVTGQNNIIAADAHNSFIGGGTGNWVQSNVQYSVISGGQNNTTQGNHTTVSGGQSNTATSLWSTVTGGMLNQANTNWMATVVGGQNSIASGEASIVLGGSLNTASESNSTASGRYANANRWGMRAYASGSFSTTSGTAQFQEMILRQTTTDNTATELSANPPLISTSTTMVVDTDETVGYEIMIVARRIDGGGAQGAAWIERGAVHNNGGTLAWINAQPRQTLGDSSAGVWQTSIQGDFTNKRIRVICTGEVGKTIRWVAHIRAVKING